LLSCNPHKFPAVCSILLGAGALTPLHKLCKSEQDQREASGLDPSIRPINSGCLLTKTVLSVVLDSPAAARAVERTKPHQLSLGTPRGIERLIHVARAAYSSNWLVGRNDFTNGFNSLSRQSMLDAQSAVFPEATAIFRFFYAHDAPVFLFDDENNVSTVLSMEGPRQGCSAGTFLFCAATVSPLQALQARYPDFLFLAVTDDVNILVPPPATDTPQGWQDVFIKYAQCLIELRDLSKRIGLTLNMTKCGLLLPPAAPPPTAEVRAMFPADFTFQNQGFRIAGSPVGTDAFMREFVDTKLMQCLSKLQAISSLGSLSAGHSSATDHLRDKAVEFPCSHGAPAHHRGCISQVRSTCGCSLFQSTFSVH